MKKLTPKGIIGLSATAFLFLILMSIIYLNNQVEFNAIEAKWELQEQYQERDIIPATYTQVAIYENEYFLSLSNSQYLINNNPNLDLNNGFDIEIEVRVNELNSINKYYLSFDDGGSTQFNILYGYKTNTFEIYYLGQGNTDTIRDNSEIVINNTDFNTIRYVYNGSTLYSYLNGNLINTFNINSFTNIYPNKIHIPRDPIDIDLKYFRINNESEYLFNEGTGSIVFDNIGNNDLNINGIPDWNLYSQIFVGYEFQIVNNTISAIDSYQVFENIRNNATTVNPLGFMNTLVSIPSQAVGYFKSFMEFLSFDISDGIQTWWRDKLLGPESGYWSLVELIQDLGD